MECGICFEGFLEDEDRLPLVLCCGHSFCKGCIRAFVYKTSAAPQCPACRRVQPRFNDWTGALPPLPVNYSLLEFIKVKKGHESPSCSSFGSLSTAAGEIEIKAKDDKDIQCAYASDDDNNNKNNEKEEEEDEKELLRMFPADVPAGVVVESLMLELVRLRQEAEQEQEQVRFFSSSLRDSKASLLSLLRQVRLIEMGIIRAGRSNVSVLAPSLLAALAPAAPSTSVVVEPVWNKNARGPPALPPAPAPAPAPASAPAPAPASSARGA